MADGLVACGGEFGGLGQHRDGITAATTGIVIIGWVWLWRQMLLCAPER